MILTPLPDPDANLELTPLDPALVAQAKQAAQERPDEFTYRHSQALRGLIEQLRKRYPVQDSERLLTPDDRRRFQPGSVSERNDDACQLYYRAAIYPQQKIQASNQSLQAALEDMKREPWLHPSQMEAAITTLSCESPLRQALYLFVEQMLDDRLRTT